MGTLFEVSHSTGSVNFKQKGTSNLVLEKGTSFPGSPSDGQTFYRTDLTQLYIYDNGLATWKTQAGGSLRIFNETPTGLVNGSNTVFTTANAYVAGTTVVTRNGLVLQPGGVDYTETTPSTGTITFVTAPSSGATVMVSYSRTIGQDVPKLLKFSAVVGTPSGTYTGSTTVFNLPFTYNVGSGSILVYSAGVFMLAGASNDYQETNSTTITFNSARTAGEVVQILKLGVANDYGNTGGWTEGVGELHVETATNQVRIGSGSAATPALAFISDTTSGLYLSSGLNWATSGTRWLSLSTSGTFHTYGAFEQQVSTISAASHTAGQESVMLCNATSNAITINLPAAASSAGRIYNIKKTDSSANTVTIDANASETIDGALTYVATVQYESVTIVCDGANWFII